MSWKRHVQLVPYGERLQKQLDKANNGRANGMGGGTGGKFSSFLPEIYAGAPNRIERYGQYNQMDLDTEISRALDTIADFCTQQEEAKDTPFEPNMKEDASESEQEILKQALTQWSDTNEFRKRLWRTFRNVIKYGDQFFVRDPETLKWHWVDHCKVEQIMVDPETKEPIQYLIRGLSLNLATLQATAGSPDAMTGSGLPGGFQSGLSSTKVMPQSSSMGGNQSVNAMSGQTNDPATMIVTAVDAIHVVHLSLGEGMDDNWPFGTSILESIFKTYKQKELLEDAILIYRVQRAPERRIFKIDTGNMPTHKAMAYLERVKNEIHQRRIPSRTGGGSSILDAAYNPMAMMDDYFFAQGEGGRGSDVSTLAGGDNLGQIDDLKYFNNKLLRGLGIPSSYLPTGEDDGSAAYSDGKVGTAYIQEYRFSKYCQRLQNMISDVFDEEFKLFLKQKDLNIESSMFELNFCPPQNFSRFRQIEIDGAQIGVFGQLADIPFFSKRFLMERYLGLNEEEILDNERKWKEEQWKKVKKSTGMDDSKESAPGIGNVGVRSPPPMDMDMGGMDDMGDMDGMDDGMGGDSDMGSESPISGSETGGELEI